MALFFHTVSFFRPSRILQHISTNPSHPKSEYCFHRSSAHPPSSRVPLESPPPSARAPTSLFAMSISIFRSVIANVRRVCKHQVTVVFTRVVLPTRGAGGSGSPHRTASKLFRAIFCLNFFLTPILGPPWVGPPPPPDLERTWPRMVHRVLPTIMFSGYISSFAILKLVWVRFSVILEGSRFRYKTR